MDQVISVDGLVAEVFAHRFVVRTEAGSVLADIGPAGARQVALRPGLKVAIEGERKPSEVKVTRIVVDGETILIEHGRDKHGPHDHAPADPAAALRCVRAAGFDPVGAPHRKPRHFEILGRKDATFTEFHIELDGTLRKSRSVASDDARWAKDMAAA